MKLSFLVLSSTIKQMQSDFHPLLWGRKFRQWRRVTTWVKIFFDIYNYCFLAESMDMWIFNAESCSMDVKWYPAEESDRSLLGELERIHNNGQKLMNLRRERGEESFRPKGHTVNKEL